MSKLTWYWHRLRAMTPGEMWLHARKKLRQSRDARGALASSLDHLERGGVFPELPDPAGAPAGLRTALAQDTGRILAGKWRAFGHLELQVDDPPRWHKDYLANVDLATNASAFRLDHRALPNGADVKLIWELSRWTELVRLAQAAYVLGDRAAAETCVAWMEDWARHNPPCRGWNWTSALESGLRLVQFTWIDALLGANAGEWNLRARLAALGNELLPAHVAFTWRHKSFGSSANNHLLGELAGVILATARWRELQSVSAGLEKLQALWEKEVLQQFAPDGGNREQALNYQLFSFEFCWQVRQALLAAGREVSSPVKQRLAAAAGFFWNVEAQREPWDYGDSDDACVTPFFANHSTRVSEWRNWFAGKLSPAIEYWLGAFEKPSEPIGFGPPTFTSAIQGWWLYPDSGIAIAESGFWWLRWDLSPLGYLATAAHGHLDALHLSVWFKGLAFVVDPGTGAYYADKNLRAWLASREAHNGPCPASTPFPRRLGPFLWSQHHEKPMIARPNAKGILRLPGLQLERSIHSSADHSSWRVEDAVRAGAGPREFAVHWQFAPGTWIQRPTDRRFVLNRHDVSIAVEVSDDWAEVHLVEQPADRERAGMVNDCEGYVSPAFRKVEWAPYLKLVARPKPAESCVFRTTFVASAPS